MSTDLQRRLNDIYNWVSEWDNKLSEMEYRVQDSITYDTFHESIDDINTQFEHISHINELQLNYMRSLHDSLLDMYEHVDHSRIDELTSELEQLADGTYDSMFPHEAYIDTYDDLSQL